MPLKFSWLMAFRARLRASLPAPLPGDQIAARSRLVSRQAAPAGARPGELVRSERKLSGMTRGSRGVPGCPRNGSRTSRLRIGAEPTPTRLALKCLKIRVFALSNGLPAGFGRDPAQNGVVAYSQHLASRRSGIPLQPRSASRSIPKMTIANGPLASVQHQRDHIGSLRAGRAIP